MISSTLISKPFQSGPIFALVRHGEYEQPPGVPSAHLPFPLTCEGCAQARAAATALAAFAEKHELSVEPIDCSRMLRAWQTASLIAEGLKQPAPTEVEELAERCVGAAANLTVAHIESLLATDPRFSAPAAGWKRDPDYRLPFQGAETLMEAGERVATHLERRLRSLAGKRTLVVCVGHGGAFRHAAHRLGVLSREQISQLSMHHGRPVYLAHQVTEASSPPDSGQWVRVAGEWKERITDPTLD